MPGFEGVHRELAEREILCDFRPDVGLRLGPHFFNTEEELDFAVSQVADIVSSKAHERHLGATARF
jgi:selenocysteine lyase/cysteine desulfurase